MNSDEITNLLTIILMAMITILFVLIFIYIVLRIKTKQPKNRKEKIVQNSKPLEATNYNKQSIFSFMEFDKIEDNMIVRKNGNKFLMVIECQGINYDLMSGLERNSVEQGFLQFLNTLRYPIQIYVQTRTVNLESGIVKYKEKVREIQDRLVKKQMELNRKENMDYAVEDIKKARLEVTKERNLYEYGVDIVNNTERMSLNKNILRKHYYIIIDYVPEDINTNSFAKEEISNMAFSDLYTKSQSIINALGVCGVKGKILDSNELAELLYIAYNRDESETYDLEKALKAGYEELYITAQDVLEKRIKELDKRIEQEAIRTANEIIDEVIEEREIEKRAKEKEAEMDELIKEMAYLIIEENQDILGKEIVNKAKGKVSKKKNTTKKTTKPKTKEEEGKNEEK
ncbi:MAG: hypothetical protein HFJ37_05125 [Clostridia bacterium]|nr:hypothetical protein [Clostridia bacterium]